MAWIVLREVPKERVQLDVTSFPVAGGFRGFQQVLHGYHHLRVLDAQHGREHVCEVWLAAPGAAEVLQFSSRLGLRPDTAPEAPSLATLAASGAMNAALIDVLAAAPARALAWQRATSAIDQSIDTLSLGSQLRDADADGGSAGASRLEAFLDAHGGDQRRALREVQAAFARLVLREDPGAALRLTQLCQAHFHAGERRIRELPEYMSDFAETLAAMRTLQPSLRELPGAADGLSYLIEDLRDVGGDRLTKAASVLAS